MLLLASALAACSIIVMPAQLTGSDHEPTRALVTAAAAAGATQATSCRVVAPDDVKALLAVEAEWQTCGIDASCLAEVGNALGADRLLSVAASRLRDRWVVEARQLDLGTGALVGHGEREAKLDSSSLRDAAKAAGAAAVAQSPVPAVLGGSGGLLLGAGALTLAASGVLWAAAYQTVTTPEAKGRDKSDAIDVVNALPIAAVVAGCAIVGGGALLVASALTGEEAP